MLTLNNFIGGKFVEPSSGQYLDNFEPATGKIYGKVPRSQPADVENAVKAAKTAFATWKKTTSKERAKILNKLADLIEKNLQKFAEAESRDTGKPLSLASTVDIPRAVDNFRFYAGGTAGVRFFLFFFFPFFYFFFVFDSSSLSHLASGGVIHPHQWTSSDLDRQPAGRSLRANLPVESTALPFELEDCAGLGHGKHLRL
jgi:hypothetical protein